MVLYTIYSILYTLYYILYTIYSILYTIYYTLYTIYCILYRLYYILYTIYSILYTIHYILYSIYYILYTVYHILYTIEYAPRGACAMWPSLVAICIGSLIINYQCLGSAHGKGGITVRLRARLLGLGCIEMTFGDYLRRRTDRKEKAGVMVIP